MKQCANVLSGKQ